MANLRLREFFALSVLASRSQASCAADGARLFARVGLHRSVPGVVAALNRRSALALPVAAPGLAFLWGIGFAHAAGFVALLHNVFVQSALLLANPAVKGTHNGGPGLFAIAGSVPPSCAPYL